MVRMRSAVRACLSAPKSIDSVVGGFFVLEKLYEYFSINVVFILLFTANTVILISLKSIRVYFYYFKFLQNIYNRLSKADLKKQVIFC